MPVEVEIIYALKHEAKVARLTVDEGTTIQQAIEQSEILKLCPEIDLGVNKVGIFSHVKALDSVVKDGDRIEIYRALVADPKESRRRRETNQTNS